MGEIKIEESEVVFNSLGLSPPNTFIGFILIIPKRFQSLLFLWAFHITFRAYPKFAEFILMPLLCNQQVCRIYYSLHF
ncbi:MAG: hypothetical protein C4B56_09335 [Candidatus Methanophagaceae archaeon]|nr:MAG: hypothetical protein C4B56_09335 [Methanophagales archaeon]